jgi:phage terminase large subunit-like protein
LRKKKRGAKVRAQRFEKRHNKNKLMDAAKDSVVGKRLYYERELAMRHARMQEEGPQSWEAKGLTRAERVSRFLQGLKITSGKLTGRKLQLRDFQQQFIDGVYHTDDVGLRHVRTAVLSMARKNGKTQLAAGMALCHLCGPEAESRGEVYSCANDRAQAAKIYYEMLAMLNESDYLRARCNAVHFHREITDLVTGSVYRALSREAKTKMGLSPSFCIYDELGMALDDELYRAMDSAMGAREEPLMMIISTQAADDFAPLSRLIDYGLRVNAKELEDQSFYLSLHATPEEDDPWSEAAWKKANPALGDFRSLEDVERLARQAHRMPAQEASFRNLILNQRVAAGKHLIERSVWNKCAGQPQIPDGAKVYAAVDLGSTKDMSALILVHQDINNIFHVQPHFWLPGDLQARSDEDRMPYAQWAKEDLLMPAGEATDPAMIALKVAELNGRYRIMSLAFDRWRITELKRELDKIGCPVTLVEHGQGYKDMSPAVDVVERLVEQQRIRHGGHPILNMNLTSAVVTRDAAGNRKLDKARSTGRIDGLVAMCMAFSFAVVRTQPVAFDVRALIG